MERARKTLRAPRIALRSTRRAAIRFGNVGGLEWGCRSADEAELVPPKYTGTPHDLWK
jgi:hypothetical protein